MSAPGVVEGQVLGRYELLLSVAQGGMARVWAARFQGTRGFRKLVAVKTILPGVMDGERMERMFLEEATLASGIHHPNVVDTLELGEQDGVLFMVLEWVDGEPLAVVMREAANRGGIPLSIGVALIAQACKGLHAAHELTDDHGNPLGVVHRDISPHNLLVSFSGIAKLVDFGVAKATQRSSELTHAGEVKGKLAYMAPEQVRGRPVDRRTDVFALGTVLYAVTTGTHPFRGEHPGETAARLCAVEPPTRPSELRPDYPAELERVVLKALEKDPDRRFATAEEMLSALEDAMPSSLEVNAEAQIASYMETLLGARRAERRKQIRAAGDLLDLARNAQASIVADAGSTSALAMDLGRASQLSAGTPIGGTAIPVAPPTRSWTNKILPAAGLLSLVIGGALLYLRGVTPAGQELAANLAPAAQPVSAVAPVVTPLEPANAGPTRPDESLPARARADGAAAVAADAAPSSSAPSRSRGQAGRSRIASKAPAPAVSAAPVPPTPAPAAADAWNPKTFGSRQ